MTAYSRGVPAIHGRGRRGEPRAIEHLGRDVLDVTGVDQHHVEATRFQDLERGELIPPISTYASVSAKTTPGEARLLDTDSQDW